MIKGVIIYVPKNKNLPAVYIAEPLAAEYRLVDYLQEIGDYSLDGTDGLPFECGFYECLIEICNSGPDYAGDYDSRIKIRDCVPLNLSRLTGEVIDFNALNTILELDMSEELELLENSAFDCTEDIETEY